MKRIVDNLVFWLKCFRAEVVFRLWNIEGVIREVKSKLGGHK